MPFLSTLIYSGIGSLQIFIAHYTNLQPNYFSGSQIKTFSRKKSNPCFFAQSEKKIIQETDEKPDN